MYVLPLDQQRKAILYAPKDLLWKILDEEEAWLKIFKKLPEEYFRQFLHKLKSLHVVDPDKMRDLARIYIKDKVRFDFLQQAVVSVWNPSDLEESTSWLKEHGFLNRPLNPINLKAEYEDIIIDAFDMAEGTKMRLARSAKGKSPKVGHPPENASPESVKIWNRVLRDKKRRKIILGPESVKDQWALAVKFWLKECAEENVPAYKSPASSSSTSPHGTHTLQRTMRELQNGLCYEGYTMSRPASRHFKNLWNQLAKDGYDLGHWKPVKPKNRLR